MNIRDSWSTPQDFRKWIVARFGFPDLDVASNENNYFSMERHFTEKDNGLAQKWTGHVWCNPPYSQPAEWIKKAIEEKQNASSILLLLRCDCGVSWHRLIHKNFNTVLLSPRINFDVPIGIKKSSNPASSILAYWNQAENIVGKISYEEWK